MAISARNQLEGKVVEVTLGDIMAHVVVKIGKNHIESVITRRSAEQLLARPPRSKSNSLSASPDYIHR